MVLYDRTSISIQFKSLADGAIPSKYGEGDV
jgi:hypothetical protein